MHGEARRRLILLPPRPLLPAPRARPWEEVLFQRDSSHTQRAVQVDNHTFSPTHVCTNLKTGVSTVGQSAKGAFHVEGQELPLIDKWPGIADCLGKDHGDKCWRQWDV